MIRMELAENITLAVAILWALWSLLSLRNAAVNGGAIFPAFITWLLLFMMSIGGVLAFHLSPLHLIWLAFLCFGLGFIAIITPLGQGIAMRFLGLLAMTSGRQDNDETDIPVNESKVSEKPESKRSAKRPRGFGSQNK